MTASLYRPAAPHDDEAKASKQDSMRPMPRSKDERQIKSVSTYLCGTSSDNEILLLVKRKLAMAIPLSTVKAANGKLKDLRPGSVGVFVGGTAGIGEFALKAFAKHANAPKIYMVGRNQEAAARITSETKRINPDAVVSFVQTPDGSLIRNVNEACQKIQASEPAINLLFITSGYLTFAGRNETSEGLDRKFSLHYYSRVRFMENLLPQLSAGAREDKGGLARVISVLAPGGEHSLHEDDLDLRHNFSLSNCAAHASMLNDFAVEELAKAHPDISFIHSSPGFVKTGDVQGANALTKAAMNVAKFALTPLATSADETGERSVFHATSTMFPAKSQAGPDAALGSDGVKGSGAYLLNWNGKDVGNRKVMRALRQKGFGKTAWDHTHEIFRQAEKTWAAAKKAEA